MGERRRRGERAGLTQQAVVVAARQELVTRGLDGVSMRGVARRLGVAPNALYSHVTGKDELLDLLLDDLLGAVVEPSACADPTATIRAIMLATYDVLLANPDAVPGYLLRQGARGPNAVRLGEVMDAALRAADVEPAQVPEARRALIIVTIGFAAFTTAPDGDGTGLLPPASARARYDQGLDWLLTGITSARPVSATGP